MPVKTEDLQRLLYNCRFRFRDETSLQAGIEQLLKSHAMEFHREYILSPKDRIDFMVGTLGIEVKVASTPAVVTRQLLRYAASPEITELMLVTTRHAHLSIPTVLLGKQVRIVHLVNSIF